MNDMNTRSFLPPVARGTENYDLGQQIDLGRVDANLSSPPNRVEALEIVAASFAKDPAFAAQVVRTLGWKNLVAARPPEPPRRMPMRGIRAIECSISHSPPRPKKGDGTTKTRKRPEREALPYYATIQVFGAKSKGLTDPVWKGAAQLRTPERAKIDARKNDRKTSLSSDYADWIENVIAPQAERDELYIGFLMDKQKNQGTYFHEFQVLLVSKEAVHKSSVANALILSQTDGKPESVLLPVFDTKTSKGPLGGNFILQSRGVISTDLYADWSTGILKTT